MNLCIYRYNDDLSWSQPEWEGTLGFFNQEGSETVECTEYCTVNDYRNLFFTIGVDIVQFKSSRQQEVKLTG